MRVCVCACVCTCVRVSGGGEWSVFLRVRVSACARRPYVSRVYRCMCVSIHSRTSMCVDVVFGVRECLRTYE